MQNQSPAGWHPDPFDPRRLRYWDGVQWTEHRAPNPGQGQPPQPYYGHVPQPPYAPPHNDANTLSIIGIVLGAVAFVFCPVLFGPAALVLGGVGMSRKERLAPVALAVGGAGLVVGVALGAVLGMM